MFELQTDNSVITLKRSELLPHLRTLKCMTVRVILIVNERVKREYHIYVKKDGRLFHEYTNEPFCMNIFSKLA